MQPLRQVRASAPSVLESAEQRRYPSGVLARADLTPANSTVADHASSAAADHASGANAGSAAHADGTDAEHAAHGTSAQTV